jgi:hypothetical protein
LAMPQSTYLRVCQINSYMMVKKLSSHFNEPDNSYL